MAQVFISTGQPNIRRMTVTGVGASYTSPVPTTTRPTTGIVLDATVAQGYDNSSLIKVMPWGVKSDGTSWTTTGTTTGFRLIGWQSYRNAAGTATWWFPTILSQYSLLFASGAAALSIDGTNDAFVFGGGTNPSTPAFPAPNVYAPGGTAGGTITTPASWLVDIAGSQLVTADFIAPSASPATVNMGLFWYAI